MHVHVVDEVWLSYELGIAPLPETSEYCPSRSQVPELRIGTISDRALKVISKNCVGRSRIEKHNWSTVPSTLSRAAKELVYKSKKDGEWHTLVQHSSKKGHEVELNWLNWKGATEPACKKGSLREAQNHYGPIWIDSIRLRRISGKDSNIIWGWNGRIAMNNTIFHTDIY